MRTFFAPGRVNLIGEYTDLVGGLVLPAAIDRGIRLECEPADRTELSTSEDVEGWQRYVDAVAAELRELGRPEVAVRGALSSTLPIGAGLSSSAALEVVVGLALCAVAGFELEPLELAKALRRAEHRAVGVPSGIMDQAASLLGRAGHALLLDTSTLSYEHVPLPAELAIAIVDSGVERRLEGTGYATRKRELEEGHPKRLRHVETENERVRAVVAALRADDRPELGRLFRAGHESLRDDLEVTTPELDDLVERAYALGAVAARMTGGGFGGAVVALVESEHADSFVDRFERAFVTHAADGAREVDGTTHLAAASRR
ncbi:MAG TPA: galactokinase family protein [Gaiellaceae bacterium]|nr:galactokinase family protein [Gaiellaceae bacterium]